MSIRQKKRSSDWVTMMKIIELTEVDSTNEYCKRLTEIENAVVTAKRQTAGEGTNGRNFVSDDGGIYLSILRTYRDFPGKDVFRIMVNSCVAVCKTLERFGVKPIIRWANDVLVGGKKISGTLIENSIKGDTLRSIVGIGININNEIPENLKNIATALCEHVGYVQLESVKDILIENLEQEFSIDDYKNYINYLGEEVILRVGQRTRTVKAIDIASDGRLVISGENGIEEISSAEVSLRLF